MGYWSSDTFPWLVRLTGMDYGTVRGVQGDLGWAFDRNGGFKQYISISFAAAHLEDNGDTYSLIGAGPMYGFNLYGFSLQVGAVVGSYNTYHSYDEVTNSGSPVQPMAQLGYTYIW